MARCPFALLVSASGGFVSWCLSGQINLVLIVPYASAKTPGAIFLLSIPRMSGIIMINTVRIPHIPGKVYFYENYFCRNARFCNTDSATSD